MKHLIIQGIDEKRLSTEGVRDKEPLNACTCEQEGVCSEVDFLANRRVEFIILSK